MKKNNASVIYKTVSGQPAMRWVRENEFPRFENEVPVVSDNFKTIFFDPDENWTSNDSERVNTLLNSLYPHQGMENPILDMLNRRKETEPPVRNLLHNPQKHNPRVISGPYIQEEGSQSLFHYLKSNATKSQPQSEQRKFVPRKSVWDNPTPKKEKPEIFHTPTTWDTPPKMFWPDQNSPQTVQEPFPVKEPINTTIHKGKEDIVEARWNVPDKLKEWWGDIKETTKNFIPFGLDEEDNKVEQKNGVENGVEEMRRIFSSPSPFHGANGQPIEDSVFPTPSERGLEKLYDKEKSNLSEKEYEELNDAVKQMRAYPKVDHWFSMIEKGGPIAFRLDPQVKNPCYDYTTETIRIPADFKQLTDKKSTMYEELTHRGQHLLYGTEAMKNNSNRQAIEGEAKTLWDYHVTQNDVNSGLKNIGGDFSSYQDSLVFVRKNGGFDNLNLFFEQSSKLGPEKTNGITAPINRKFDPLILKYYNWKKK